MNLQREDQIRKYLVSCTHFLSSQLAHGSQPVLYRLFHGIYGVYGIYMYHGFTLYRFVYHLVYCVSFQLDFVVLPQCGRNMCSHVDICHTRVSSSTLCVCRDQVRPPRKSSQVCLSFVQETHVALLRTSHFPTFATAYRR